MNEIPYQKLKTEVTDFGVYDFYQYFVVGEWTVDHATAEQVEILRILFDEFFQGKPYGYIGNRVNPHSVDVAEVRTVLQQAKNLKNVAYVIYSTVAQNVANVEKTFYDSHQLHVYSDLGKAIEWMSAEMVKIRDSESKATNP